MWPRLAEGRQSEGRRFLGTVPLGNPGGGPTTPLGRLLGNGLDARQFADLSTIDPHEPATLVNANDRFYVRTAAPAEAAALGSGAAATARLFKRATGLDFESLERLAVRPGPVVVECAGNADPANFGLISAATWEGIPIPAVLDRLPAGPPGSRVLVSGIDDPGPSRTSIPGASWIFSRDQLEHALLATGMNDAPLPLHHGAPIRLLVPGWYGCACIKWVDAIRFVPDSAPATSQMQEFAARTHQPFALSAGSPADARPARDYEAAAIDTAAAPVRVEKWIAGGRIEYRVVGLIWGGTKTTNALSIRFRIGQSWTKVDDCPLPSSTSTWGAWTHTWRPAEPGRYQIVLRVDDPTIRTRRLDLFYYVREVDIQDV